MQRLFVLPVLVLTISCLAFGQGPIAPPDLQLWVFNKAAESTIDVFDGYNSIIDTVIANCQIDGPYFDAAVAGDGNIWFSVNGAGLQAYDPETRNCTMYLYLGGSFTYVGPILPGLGGKYLYFLGDGKIWRMDLVTYAQEMFLAAPSDVFYIAGFGFQNNKMYTSTQYVFVDVEPQILTSYDYDLSNDEPILTEISQDAWAPRVGFLDHFVKFKKCPRSSEYFCAIPTVSGGQWVWSSLVNGSDSWVVIDTYVPAFYGANFRDYYTAPWGYMYATDDDGGFYNYDWTVPTIPVSMSPFVIDANPYGTFVALIGAPYINIQDYGGVCFADVYFNSYYWTTKYSIEVKNSVTGLYEDYYVMPDYVGSDVEARYVNMEVVCDAPTKSYRIRFEGDTNMSDNVYSIPTTVPCSCISVPVAVNVQANVVPILECIEKVDETNYVVHLGYENTEGSPVYIPAGENNQFSDIADRGQPTLFREGRTNFFPTSAFSFVVSDSSFSWYLSYYQLPIDTQDTAVYCPASLRVSIQFFYSIIEPNDQNIEIVRVAMAEYLQISESRVKVIGYQVTPVTKRAGLGSGNNVDLEAEIGQAGPGTQEPPAADSVRELVQAGKNQTAGDKIIDPSSQDPDSEILGVKPLPTGVEQSGGSTRPGSPNNNSPSGSTSQGVSATSASPASVIALILGVTYYTMLYYVN